MEAVPEAAAGFGAAGAGAGQGVGLGLGTGKAELEFETVRFSGLHTSAASAAATLSGSQSTAALDP